MSDKFIIETYGMKLSIGTKVGQSSYIELKQQIKFAQKWNQPLSINY